MTALNTNSINEILARCKAGENLAYNELYKHTSKPVYNSIVRLISNQEDAKDLLQETYIAVFNNLQNYKEAANITTWIKRIAVNKTLNEIKRKKINFSTNDNLIELPDIIEDEDFEYAKYDGLKVANAITELPEGYRIILSLYLFEDLSHQEIAIELGISVSTSKSQYHRGKLKLKELLMVYNNSN